MIFWSCVLKLLFFCKSRILPIVYHFSELLLEGIDLMLGIEAIINAMMLDCILSCKTYSK